MKLTKSNSRELTLVHALVHGESGVGKTTSLGTLPVENTLIVTMERGLIPLRDKEYNVAVVKEWDDLRELMRVFVCAKSETDGSLTLTFEGEELKGIKILAIDSLSEANELCKKNIVQVDRPALIKERTEGERETALNAYDDLMTMEDYNLLRTRMVSFISAVNHLPVHTIFTALSDWKEDKKTGMVMRTPNLAGKFALECAAYFDLVLYMKSNETGDRVWQTINTGAVLAKDATAALEKYEETNWTKIFGKILGTKTTTTKKEK